MVDVSKLGSNPNEPRAIRARTGNTQDPLPPGKKLEEKEFPNIEPADHGKSAAGGAELSKEDIKAHKEELRHMQKADAKHGGAPNNLSKRDPVQSIANLGTSKEPMTR